MRAVALVVSAREHGNGHDFATFVLERLRANGAETELINFFDFDIQPCHNCAYECLQRRNPAMGKDSPCPIQDK